MTETTASVVMFLGLFATACSFIFCILRWAKPPDPADLPPRWDREQLTVVCMDCRAHIGGPKVNLADAMQARAVSHGLCPDCLRRRLAELESGAQKDA